MKKALLLFFLAWSFLFISIPLHAEENKEIRVTILHMNDVYEITPVGGGREGGLARVASLRKELLRKNPQTITTLGGDLFSPSAMGTAVHEGEKLAGRQMVEVLNALKLDYATFGNHEFDIKEKSFLARIQETKFGWISSNVFDQKGTPFQGVMENKVLTFTNEDGRAFRIGLFGLTLASNRAEYVSYKDPFLSAKEQISKLDGKTDFIIALTHLDIDDDEKLLAQAPGIGLILGGHEHVNFQHWRGAFTPLLKADANVRSVYVVELVFNPKTGKTRVEPRLVPINDQLVEDPEVKEIVDIWTERAYNAFRREGLNPEENVTVISQPLVGLESEVRSGETNLTRIVAESMLIPYKDAELSLLNSGSIRIDDNLPPGGVSVYDVIRIAPFGGKVMKAEISGDILQQALDAGDANRGTGGFLQHAGVVRQDGAWKIQGVPLDVKKKYIVAISDYLVSGKEINLGFLKDIKILDEGKDNELRQLIIRRMRK